jgi:anion-transporting  ArsA/GET3 family ATPase
MDFADFCAGARVMIVAGKGGVGKTTVAATMAVSAARCGLSVLIVEVEGKSGLTAAFGLEPLSYDEIDLAPNIRARTLTPDAALIEYLEDHGMKRIARRLAASGVLDVVATAVPGMRDILVLGKIKQLEQARAADLIVVDAPAAGHAVSFLMSPAGLLDAVSVGPIRKQAEDVVAMLRDPERAQVMLVTLPEETPVNELVDTAYALEDRVGIQLAPVVVNACSDAPPNVADIEGDCPDIAALRVAVAFATERHSLEQTQRARLRDRLALAQITLPFLPTASVTLAEIEVLADRFIAEVGRW